MSRHVSIGQRAAILFRDRRASAKDCAATGRAVRAVEPKIAKEPAPRYFPRKPERLDLHAAEMRRENEWLIAKRKLAKRQPRTANGQRWVYVDKTGRFEETP